MALNAFYFLSFLAIMSAIMVVLSKNPVYSVLYLIITFFCIAGHYTLMNAQFLAIVHIIVYAGAIMVLFLYVIMLLNLNKESEPHKSNILKFAATICAGLIMLVLIGSLKGTENMLQQQPAAADIGLVITSVLLLAAMVGAVMLGKPESR